MRVAMFASEMVPYIKTGGLADVIGSLPRALAEKCNQIDVFIPYYREIERLKLPLKKLNINFNLKIGSRKYNGAVFKLITDLQNLTIYFIDNYHFFRRRSQLYIKDGYDYHDNLARFTFFCRGSLEVIKHLSSSGSYDIFHMHDWQTALIGLYAEISDFFQKNSPFRIYTIHNLAYQGKFSRSHFHILGIDSSYFDSLEYWGKFILMKAGILFSDIITTVSPTYAQEIQTKEYGVGLEKLLKQNRSKISGILNGVDYNIWNPETDRYIPSNYSIDDLSGKAICKTALQQHFLLTENPTIPILSVVSRLAWQKGMELVLKVVPKLLDQNKIQFVLLGTGDPKLEQQFNELSKKYPSKVGIALTYNDHLAHQIEAGADIFLMPSRYEPCGLNDKYSLRYGTIPVAFNTGGLADSIIDYSTDANRGTGFLFKTYDESHFISAIDKSLKIFQIEHEWEQIMLRGMLQDFSWQNSADAYFKLYQTRI
ncbi:MAG: glycogen synthase GlgA [Candidatus Heimdallarchaeota archaeon]|nr:MAG: glycogen synthase GlgA [Candidatus Heimdallarchaeota archaeon]